MLPYIILLLFPFFVKLFYTGECIKKYKFSYVFIALLPLFIILGFKGNMVGSDTPNYIRIFENATYFDILGERSMNEQLEIGYKVFIHLLTSITSVYQWQFIIVGALVYVSIGYFVYKHAKDPALAILLFITLGYFQFTLSGIRQTMAMSIILFSYEFIKRRNFIKYFIIVIIAALFHKSALFFLPTYFIACRQFTRKNIFITIMAFSIFFIFSESMLLWSADVFEYNYGIEETDNGYIFFIIVLVITILSLIFNKQIIRSNKNNVIFLNINIVSFFLWCMRLISRTVERVSFYFLPATCIILEEFVVSIKNSKYRIAIYFLVFIFSSALFIYRIYNNPSLVPYQFCNF